MVQNVIFQVRREYPELPLKEAIEKWQKLFRDLSEEQSDEEEICEGLSNDQLGILWLAREVTKTYQIFSILLFVYRFRVLSFWCSKVMSTMILYTFYNNRLEF